MMTNSWNRNHGNTTDKIVLQTQPLIVENDSNSDRKIQHKLYTYM